MTQAAEAAKAIREELKTAFPSITFRIKSRNFSMGDAVDVYYTNGVPVDQIRKITDKYEYGHFNGMEDIYEISNSRSDIPQAKYVHVQRNIDKEVSEAMKVKLANDFGITDIENEDEWQRVFKDWSTTVVYRQLSEMTL